MFYRQLKAKRRAEQQSNVEKKEALKQEMKQRSLDGKTWLKSQLKQPLKPNFTALCMQTVRPGLKALATTETETKDETVYTKNRRLLFLQLNI